MNTRLFPRELVEAAAEYHVGREDDVEAAKSYIGLLESHVERLLFAINYTTPKEPASHIVTESGYLITDDGHTVSITHPGVG